MSQNMIFNVMNLKEINVLLIILLPNLIELGKKKKEKNDGGNLIFKAFLFLYTLICS